MAAGVKKVSFGISGNDTFMHMPSRHAEAEAFQRIRFKKNMPRRLDVFVVRYGKAGGLGSSRPCYHCIQMMMSSGLNIKDIYYSTNEGTIVKERLSEMMNSENTYVSSGIRSKTGRVARAKRLEEERQAVAMRILLGDVP